MSGRARRASSNPHPPRERGETGGPLFEQRRTRPVRDAQALFEAPQEAPSVAERLGGRRSRYPHALQRTDGHLRLGRAHPGVASVTHLKRLRRELHVDHSTAPELHVVPARASD